MIIKKITVIFNLIEFSQIFIKQQQQKDKNIYNYLYQQIRFYVLIEI